MKKMKYLLYMKIILTEEQYKQITEAHGAWFIPTGNDYEIVPTEDHTTTAQEILGGEYLNAFPRAMKAGWVRITYPSKNHDIWTFNGINSENVKKAIQANRRKFIGTKSKIWVDDTINHSEAGGKWKYYNANDFDFQFEYGLINESKRRKIIITEGQLEILVNEKPAEDFDVKYGTTLSQRYKFPLDANGDDLWRLWVKCYSSWYLPPNTLRNEPQHYCNILKKVVDKLTFEHFPYNGVESLPDKTKTEILMGMASRFNFDDIVSYAIKGIHGMHNTEIEDELNRTFPNDIVNDIEWVVSRPTLEKMKQQIKDRKLKMIDYI